MSTDIHEMAAGDPPTGDGADSGPRGTAAPNGAAFGYRATGTLRLGTELRRQFGRKRTQLSLGFMVLLPMIILAAFQFGSDNRDDRGGRGQFASLADIATGGGLNFTLFTLLVSASFLLVVIVALYFGDTIASEASWGSLRYLLAIPIPRGRLLGIKMLVASITSAVALALLTGTALTVGTLRYGWHPLRSTVAQDLAPGVGLWRILLIVGYLSVSLLVVAGLAFALSVSTDAPLGAVGGAVLLNILSSILDQITALGGIRNFLPTHYSDAWLGLLSTPIQTGSLVRGCLAAVSYAVIFFGLAWWRFLRKDVVS